ncbi:hypothetical protein FKZ61_005485, partial [Litorilinea aerophila]|nr:hypothetical protein [Litorilinea aerophila]
MRPGHLGRAGIALLLGLAFLLGGLAGQPALAQMPQLTYGSATVDGQIGEWNLSTDRYAAMYPNGDASQGTTGDLYLRYNCANQTMYALVLLAEGVTGLAQPNDAWVALETVGNVVVDGNTAGNFAWVGVGFDGNSGHVQGYEAAFPVTPNQQVIQHLIAQIQTLSGVPSSTERNGDSGVVRIKPRCPVGNLQVTKTVDWNGFPPDATQSFEICITGPAYPNGNCQSIGPDGGILSWNNIAVGTYTITETDAGTAWTTVISGSPATVTAGATANASVANTHDAFSP